MAHNGPLKFLTRKKVLLVILGLIKFINFGINERKNVSTPSIFVLEPNFLHQNHCFNVAQLMINVSQTSLYYFKSRHDG